MSQLNLPDDKERKKICHAIDQGMKSFTAEDLRRMVDPGIEAPYSGALYQLAWLFGFYTKATYTLIETLGSIEKTTLIDYEAAFQDVAKKFEKNTSSYWQQLQKEQEACPPPKTE